MRLIKSYRSLENRVKNTKRSLPGKMSVLVIVLFVLFWSTYARSNDTSFDAPKLDLVAGEPVAPAPVDPSIRRALDQISTSRIEQTISRLVSFNNRNTLSSMEKDLPQGQGVSAAADWIETQFRQEAQACGGCLEVKRDTFTEQPQERITQPTTISNVYAILRGTDPSQNKRMYLVTGHYDSRNSNVENTRDPAPGANDDASGVAVSLECARVLSKLKFPATLVFVAVAGEEQGLNGSRHLAKLARSEGWQLEGVLNNDIVGGDTTPGDKLQNRHLVRVFSEAIPASASPEQIRLIQAIGAESDSPSRELARQILDVSRTYFGSRGGAPAPSFRPVLEFRRDRFLRGGDHTSFNQQGFAAVRLTEWRENFNHQHQDVRRENGVQYGDLLRFVDYEYVAKVARLNAATLATLASAPGQPQDVRILAKELENNTTLSWSAPEGAPTGTRYQIVWRETAAADWQYGSWSTRFGDTGNGVHHTATLPVSKDNVILGVRSVDTAGHRSLVSIPTPQR
jgi:Peptidase family M28